MSKKKRRRKTPSKKNCDSKQTALTKLALATAILTLIRSFIDLLTKVIDWLTVD